MSARLPTLRIEFLIKRKNFHSFPDLSFPCGAPHGGRRRRWPTRAVSDRPGPDELVPSRYALRVGEIDVQVVGDGVLSLPAATGRRGLECGRTKNSRAWNGESQRALNP